MELDSLLEKLQPVIGFFGDYPYVKALIVFVLTLAVANLVAMLISKVFLRLARRTSSTLDNRLIELFHHPLFWTVVVVGTLAAMHLLELPPAIDKIARSLSATVLIVLWSLFVLRSLRIILRKLSSRAQGPSVIRNQTLPLFDNLLLIIVLVVAVYFIFGAWGVDMTAWLASAGIAGIAIGFAAKDTLSNLFSGVFIMADSPYKIGDYIVLDSGQRGKVTQIGIRSTRLLTRGDVEITIPNAIIGNSSIINESGGPYEKFRIELKVGVAYGSDIDQVRQILLEIGEAEEGLCDEPEPRVRFRNFGDSGLDFELLGWVENPELRGRILDSMNSAVYKRFLKEGIEIPYPKRDLYIKQMPGQL
jgi:MscS family membrane protein